jgi:Putative prokaryotic signal transducing protein
MPRETACECWNWTAEIPSSKFTFELELVREVASVAGFGFGTAARGERDVRELVRTNDIVLVSAIGALLDGANIHHLVLDQNMSVIEGSLGVLPRRILVHEDDNREARQILTDAGLGHELRAEDAGR